MERSVRYVDRLTGALGIERRSDVRVFFMDYGQEIAVEVIEPDGHKLGARTEFAPGWVDRIVLRIDGMRLAR